MVVRCVDRKMKKYVDESPAWKFICFTTYKNIEQMNKIPDADWKSIFLFNQTLFSKWTGQSFNHHLFISPKNSRMEEGQFLLRLSDDCDFWRGTKLYCGTFKKWPRSELPFYNSFSLATPYRSISYGYYQLIPQYVTFDRKVDYGSHFFTEISTQYFLLELVNDKLSFRANVQEMCKTNTTGKHCTR